MQLYRISPILWKDRTVYGIDRVAPGIPSVCSSRPREDPASVWDSPTFQRLLPPPDSPYTPIEGVSWATLPAWLSWIQTRGYTLSDSLSKLKPYDCLYVEGP
jgi:hypothetical protein